MDCREAVDRLVDFQRGLLRPRVREDVRAHLDTCAACSRLDREERALTDLLERRLPQHPAPLALKRRLVAQWPAESPPARSWWRRWRPFFAPALAAAIMLLVAIPLVVERAAVRRTDETADMVREAVNDYLRLLTSQHPLEIESGGIHQVKPWFEGRLDFAPVVSFEGNQEFPLRGGAVGYFLNRKAATFVYSRRLHTISLFVFRAEGLPWPTRGLEPLGKVQAYVTTARGFNVVLWQAGGLGYALVSDLDARELLDLGKKLAGSP